MEEMSTRFLKVCFAAISSLTIYLWSCGYSQLILGVKPDIIELAYEYEINPIEEVSINSPTLDSLLTEVDALEVEKIFKGKTEADTIGLSLTMDVVKLPDLSNIFLIYLKEDKIEENLVKGCQSQVWLIATEKEGNVYFEADSDAIISKGICALLVKVFNGQPASEIVKNNLGFIEKIGLKEHLSPNRSNGLVAMIKKIKAFALVFSNT